MAGVGARGLLGRVLRPGGLGRTCLRIGHGGNTTKISKVAVGRLKRCLGRGNRRVGSRVHAHSCRPGPIGQVRVPGTSKNIQGLNIPAIISQFVRRTVTRILAPVCRRGFRRGDCKFEPKQYTRVTVVGDLRFVGSKCA